MFTASGVFPVSWPGGKELFYNSAGAMMGAPLLTVTGTMLEPGAPVVLFSTRLAVRRSPRWALLINTELDSAQEAITLLMNSNPRRRSERADDRPCRVVASDPGGSGPETGFQGQRPKSVYPRPFSATNWLRLRTRRGGLVNCDCEASAQVSHKTIRSHATTISPLKCFAARSRQVSSWIPSMPGVKCERTRGLTPASCAMRPASSTGE